MPEITRGNAQEYFRNKLGIRELKGIIIDTGDDEKKIDLKDLTMEQLRALSEIDPKDREHGKPFDDEDGYLRINMLFNETFGFSREGEEIGY